MSNEIHDPATEGAIPCGKWPTTPKKGAKPAVACGCGCGDQAKRGSHFLQGHDQRLKGMLQRVASGRCYEGESAAVAKLLQSKHPGHASSTMAPLVKAAQAKLAKPKAA